MIGVPKLTYKERHLREQSGDLEGEARALTDIGLYNGYSDVLVTTIVDCDLKVNDA